MSILHPDRFFDPEPAVRRAARAVYEETRELPILSPHGHVDPALLAHNDSFGGPTTLFLTPDHYLLRMLYSRGLPFEEFGPAANPRQAWQLFADHYYLFQGTPSGIWLDHELHEVFGLSTRLTGENAQHLYDELTEKLASPEFRPRALFERFRVEALCTTDRASDTLEAHRAIRASGLRGRVIPCLRPDALLKIAARDAWRAELAAVENVSNTRITDFEAFMRAVATRRQFFKSAGATATDHAVVEPYTASLSPQQAERLFQSARAGLATAEDERRFEAHMLMEMARLSIEDGLVMQLHAGALRNHNHSLFERFGADTGADIPVTVEFTRNLQPLLNAYGNDPRLTLILFTLDEGTYSRELAPLAGHYPALRLGPPWWFHDSPNGMRRFREHTTETAGFYNTAGFNDDTRAFCSIPARHDLARRMDANYLGGLVARHIIDLADARRLGRTLAYDLVKETYKL
jgi:glucuronate isomerase